ncbi:uncharacterized protein LOC113209223 isoform X1 [Frankliniella occidentalis]|uniref:Uncharacterized protein LOC113209223 isoform X1 n=1 Tax=Frankliniella occidentalis TaxID=133901 RepID=A0A6J1SSX0_FRAOC|nr:uncharacterized protein LOC113209223 isoform X1 [Frankliniella occidentalis]
MASVRTCKGGDVLRWRVVLAVVAAVAADCASANVVTPAGLPVNSLQQPLQQPPVPPTPEPIPSGGHAVGAAPSGFVPITASPPPAMEVASGRQAAADAGNWRLVGKLLLDCSRTGDLVGCLKLKAVATLGRALTSDAAIPIMEDLSLARDPDADVKVPETPQTETELEATLPRALEERSGRLDRLLLERLDAFIRSRTVQFSMPLGLGVFEGRGKGGLGGKKGMGGYILLLVAGMKAMMMQSAMGGIAMMSGKALIIAKIALLLALLCCLKKGGGEEHKSQIVYAAPAEHSGGGAGWQSSGGGGGGDWNRRSANDPNNYAQSYAYSAHHRY